jgi:signal transduction histidine kinase
MTETNKVNWIKDKGDRFFAEKTGVFRLVVLLFSIAIGSGSIWYTNGLVDELKEREQRMMDLYASTLEYVANENISDNSGFTFLKIIEPNNSIPVILTDHLGNPTDYRNLQIDDNWSLERKKEYLEKEKYYMSQQNYPIKVELFDQGTQEVYSVQYIYYKNSLLLQRLRFYPYVQLSVIAAFAFMVYLAFSYSKRAEQNRVWVGLAKETAHQLGTPISSLMAWAEYLRSDPDFQHPEMVVELEKDIQRLEMITNRFSNIGSATTLKHDDIEEIIRETVGYLQKRVSTKVQIEVSSLKEGTKAYVNRALFEWVIENLCKNAVDAMAGVGKIHIHIIKGSEKRVFIDISDTGKGIAKSKVKEIFQAGFTTKKRGWGLGLTLAKRIVENYHGGRIFVKSSEPDKGTTFRIILKA